MRTQMFTIGIRDGYEFSVARDGWIRVVARTDGLVPVIGGQSSLHEDISAPTVWSAAEDATGNNMVISDGDSLYTSASFDDSLVQGQVEDVMWALERGELPASGRLLELGCGPGFLLSALQTRLPGWTMSGIDPSATSAAQARFRGLDVVDGTVDTAEVSGPFDAVVVMGNFQLHNDPAATLTALAGITRPGGVMYLDSKNPRTAARVLARLAVQTPGLRRVPASHAFAAHAFHGMRHGLPKQVLTTLMHDSGWDVTEVRTTSPRLLRFHNEHKFGTGLRAKVWRGLDAWDSRMDERAWLQVAGTRK